MSNLLENCIYVAESEGKMFDTLINLEFVDILKEADLSDQEEDYETGNGSVQADVEADGDPVTRDKFKEFKATVKIKIINIAKKIKEILDNLINSVTNAVSNFLSKLSDFFTTDKQVVAKYKDLVLNPNNYSGFEGIENFQVPKNNNNEVPPAIKDTMFKIADENNLLFDSKDQSDIDNIKNTINNELNEYLEKLNNYYGDCFETVSKWMPSEPFMKDAIEFMEVDESVNNIAKEHKGEVVNVKNMINKLRNSAKVETLINKLDNSDNGKLELAKASASFEVMSKASSAIAKYVKLTITVDVARFRAYRHAVMAVGKFASSKETTQEAVDFRYIIGEASNIAVDEAFAFI